jgi:magnesium chelatase subunit H
VQACTAYTACGERCVCMLCVLQAAETYALDPEMAATLRQNNPQAFSNMLKRMLEAAGRGMWQADAQTLQQLRNMYAEMDDVLEGVAR